MLATSCSPTYRIFFVALNARPAMASASARIHHSTALATSDAWNFLPAQLLTSNGFIAKDLANRSKPDGCCRARLRPTKNAGIPQGANRPPLPIPYLCTTSPSRLWALHNGFSAQRCVLIEGTSERMTSCTAHVELKTKREPSLRTLA